MRAQRLAFPHASLASLALGLLPGAIAAQSELLDDFAVANDKSWTHIDLLAANNLGKTIYDASSQRYRIASSSKLPPLPVTAATLAGFTPSLADARFGNGVLRATVRFDNPETNAGIVMRTDPTQINGYAFSLNNRQNAIFIDRIVRGVGTKGGIGGVTSFPMELKENTDYIVEASALGGELMLRVWESGQTPPPTAQLRALDAAYTTGALGLFVYNQPTIGGTLSAQFDDVIFTPCATVTAFGTGCPGNTGVPDFRVVGRATGGERIYFSVREGRPNALSVVVLAAGRAKAAGGCKEPILIDGFVAALPLALSGAGDGAVALDIPKHPSLKATVTTQAFVVDNTSPLGIATSPGLELLFR